jgi:hypothetical protein
MSMSTMRVSIAAACVALCAAAPAARANTYHVTVRGGGAVVAPAVVRPGYAPGAVVRPPVVGPPRVWTGPRWGGYHGPSFGYRYYWTYPRFYGYGYGYPYYVYTQPYVAPAPAYAPPAVVAARVEREPTIGVGIRGSSIRAGENRPTAEGLGALLRFRARPVEVELEVGWDNYGQGTERSDTRVATSLYVPIFGRELQPYLVVGAGMNFANFGTTGDVLHQGFMDGGGGLALNLGRSFTIGADVRYEARHFFDNADLVARQPLLLSTGPGTTTTTTTTANDRDEAVEVRANAIVYF